MRQFLNRLKYTIHAIMLATATLILMVGAVWFSSYYVASLEMQTKRQRLGKKRFNKRGAVSYLERLFNNA